MHGVKVMFKEILETAYTVDDFPKSAVVACQGTDGAYSGIACKKAFENSQIIYFNSFEAVFRAVDTGLCEYGVLPIENSSNGSVSQVYDLMKRHNFYIVRGIKLAVNHNLLMNSGGTKDNIKEIISHEQALGQCSGFIESTKGVKVTLCVNTAVAARTVAESGRIDMAAISSFECAEYYGLKTLSREICNEAHNYTRFICISKTLKIFAGAEKIGVMLILAHKPGALVSVLSKISEHGFNLTKLESRPLSGREFEFMFYFDIETNGEDISSLLDELERASELLIFLGHYSEIYG